MSSASLQHPGKVVLLGGCAALLGYGAARPGLAGEPVALVNAHAHNDYEHPRPLLDALECGFCSVEADVHLVNGKLLVAHDRIKVRPEHTLQALYLDPLQERITKNGGRVYRGGPTVTLLIELKTPAEPTYAALEPLLEKYREMLTSWRDGQPCEGAVTVIITGNRPCQVLRRERIRMAAIDGDLEDLGGPADLAPLVSSRWGASFTWNGKGAMPAEQRDRLRELVSKAHAAGQRIRFWGAPDNPTTWRELLACGVDLINTDHLQDLRTFLLDRRSGETVSPRGGTAVTRPGI